MTTMRSSKGASRSHARGSDPGWVRSVTSVSTFPPAGLFTKDARTIARSMADPKVSPKGIGSGIRMIQYFLNRGGRGLPASRRRVLERAKRLLQEQRSPVRRTRGRQARARS